MNVDTAYLAMRWLAAAIFLTTIGSALASDQVLGSKKWSDVSGMVTDDSGAVVVQAEVLFNCGGAIVKTSTNQKGFSAKLPSGDCSITVQALGFEIKTITGLQIHPPQPVILNIVLQAGSTRIEDGLFPPQDLEPIPAAPPFLLVEEVQTDTEMGSICVLPNSPKPPTRISPGGEYNPDTLTLRLDKREPIHWPHKKPVLIENLDIQHEHFVVLTSDGKRIQSFRFKFSDYHDAKLCVYFDGYQGVQLENHKDALWCKVKNRDCWR